MLDERSFRRIEKYTNKENEWDAWQSNIEVAMAAVHMGTSRLMEEIVRVEEVTMDKMAEMCTNIADELGQDREKLWVELAKAKT